MTNFLWHAIAGLTVFAVGCGSPSSSSSGYLPTKGDGGTGAAGDSGDSTGATPDGTSGTTAGGRADGSVASTGTTAPSPRDGGAGQGDGSHGAGGSLLSPSDGVASLLFVNQCGFAVRVGQTSASGSLAPYATMYTLDQGKYAIHDLGPDTASYPALAFFGARVDGDPGAPHYTIAQMSLNGAPNNLDFYGLGLVDGFNLPVSITPADATTCAASACGKDLLPGCPDGNRFPKTGTTLACLKSTTADNASDPAAQFFEAQCPDAAGWSGDAAKTRACGGQDYAIVFCP